ncbi:MAG: hypothetical protein Kow0027_20390 [Saprospiraceae bacterium]
MKFPIQNIEANIDENALLVGERIFERNDFELVKVDRNLWIANIDQFEIEIQLSGQNVKAYSCECPAFEKTGICGHIVAVLFALRRKLTEGEKGDKQVKKQRAQNLSINQLLSSIPPEDLQAYVRQYARKNRLFGLALKVRFAAAIPYDDNKAKYNELLDTVFKYIISRQGTISPQGMKHLAGFIDMLNNQADDAIALEHYTEAFDLLSVVISRLLNMGKKRGQNAEDLQKSMQKTCDKLSLLAGKAVSPDLRAEIWQFTRAHFVKGTARQLGVSGHLLSISLELSDEKQRREEIISKVSEQLKIQGTIDHKLDLVNRLIPILIRHKDALTRFRKALAEQQDYLLLLRTAEQLMLAGLPKESLLAARHALAVGLPVDLHFLLRKTMLTAAEQAGTADEIFEHAIWLYHETNESGYFLTCQSVISQVSEQRIEEIKNQIQFFSNDFLELALYALREQWQELIAAIAQKGNIEVLMRFAGPLYEIRPDETFQLFESHFDHYLKTHFGPVPARQVSKWLRKIELNCSKSLGNKLRSFLQRNYPGKLNYETSDF